GAPAVPHRERANAAAAGRASPPGGNAPGRLGRGEGHRSQRASTDDGGDDERGERLSEHAASIQRRRRYKIGHVDLPPHVPDDARRCLERAYSAHMDGRLAEAIEHYKESIALSTTS